VSAQTTSSEYRFEKRRVNATVTLSSGQSTVGCTVLYNRPHVVLVALADNEAEREPGYSVATRRFVSLLLSTGQRVAGAVRVYQPAGRDRLSDWTRQPGTFRYLETGDQTLLVNAEHIVDISEVPEP
jgi:hypothetical protein